MRPAEEEADEQELRGGGDCKSHNCQCSDNLQCSNAFNMIRQRLLRYLPLTSSTSFTIQTIAIDTRHWSQLTLRHNQPDKSVNLTKHTSDRN